MSFAANGKAYRKPTGTANRKLAENILSKVKTQIVEGKWFENDEARLHTFDEMEEKYLREYCPTHTAASTMRRDERYIELHLTPFSEG